jgi:hypothetical protein
VLKSGAPKILLLDAWVEKREGIFSGRRLLLNFAPRSFTLFFSLVLLGEKHKLRNVYIYLHSSKRDVSPISQQNSGAAGAARKSSTNNTLSRTSLSLLFFGKRAYIYPQRDTAKEWMKYKLKELI